MDKTVTVFSAEQYESAWPFDTQTKLADAISWLQSKLEEIPPEYRADATFRIESSTAYDSSTASLEIEYVRPETPEEERQRAERDCRAAEDRRQRELATLLALKAKYPDASYQ